jgi:curved DNA-binding protein CbpA
VSGGRDPYEVLGVPRGASVRQIRAAYVQRARRSHPDLVGSRGLDLMRVLNEAWEILKDAGRRAAYDTATGGPPLPGGPGAPSSATDDSERPFWTGAAGPPPGRPSGPVLDFGIFADWSLGEISRRDPGYLRWLRDRPEAKPIRAEIDQLLDPEAEPARETRGRRR